MPTAATKMILDKPVQCLHCIAAPLPDPLSQNRHSRPAGFGGLPDAKQKSNSTEIAAGDPEALK
jgi:hypothetical protein